MAFQADAATVCIEHGGTRRQSGLYVHKKDRILPTEEQAKRHFLLAAVAIVPLLAVSGWCVGSCSDNREGLSCPRLTSAGAANFIVGDPL